MSSSISTPLFQSTDHPQTSMKSRKPELRTTLNSLKSHISSRHCAWLTITILLQLIIFLCLNLASPPPPPPPVHHRRRHQSTTTPTLVDPTCRHGRIYVYNLPPLLNKDLVDNCKDIDPWKSRCNTVLNSGFGPPATGLDSIIPKNLTPAWFWTDMYAAEVIYHDRILSYKCRTLDQNQASAFYIPFYAGLAVGKYLWFNYTSKDRDFHSLAMLEWVTNQQPWKNSNGSDHFIMLGRLTWDFRRLPGEDDAWGTQLIYMPLFGNVLHLSMERSPWDKLEVSVPYPTAFHPRSESDIRVWQRFVRGRIRSTRLAFVGATRKNIRNDFREVLMRYCENETTCALVDCSTEQCGDGASKILEVFLDSDFCFQPRGDGATRRSQFDCMLAGGIPVYFWEDSFHNQYEWHLPRDASKCSVFIHHSKVRKDPSIIKRTLDRYSEVTVRRMRDTIVDMLPRLLYVKSNIDFGGLSDSFDVAMEGVLKRFEYSKKMGGSLLYYTR